MQSRSTEHMKAYLAINIKQNSLQIEVTGLVHEHVGSMLVIGKELD